MPNFGKFGEKLFFHVCSVRKKLVTHCSINRVVGGLGRFGGQFSRLFEISPNLLAVLGQRRSVSGLDTGF